MNGISKPLDRCQKKTWKISKEMVKVAVTTNAQEKQELFKTIWKIADDLRGKVDGWDFKSYVLGTLFYRYLSENIADHII